MEFLNCGIHNFMLIFRNEDIAKSITNNFKGKLIPHYKHNPCGVKNIVLLDKYFALKSLQAIRQTIHFNSPYTSYNPK